MVSKRLLIVGLDGVPWHILEYLFENNGMPYLKHIASSNKSKKAFLKSTLPPWTPIAWNSIASGVNPGKHGIFSFHIVERKKEGFYARLVSGYDLKYPRIHEMASMFGLKSIAINIPVTYPPSSSLCKDCIVVNDWMAPDIDIYPYELRSKYKHYFASNLEGMDLKGSSPSALKKIARRAETFGEGALEILEKYEWNIAFIIFSETDWSMHDNVDFVSKRKLGYTIDVFNAVDRFIRKATPLAEDLIIVSDHGFTVCPNLVNIPYFLRKHGLLDIVFREGLEVKIGPFKVPKKIVQFVKKYKHLKVIARKLVRKAAKSYKGEKYIAYNKAKVIVPDAGVIYVAPGWRDEVYKVLKNIPGLIDVIPSEKVYSGPWMRYAPDFLVVPENDYCISVGKDKPYDEENSAHHTLGIMMAYGDNIESVWWTNMFETWDVATYALSLLGLPIPIDTDSYVSEKASDKKYNYLAKWRLAKKMRNMRLTG